jgi:AcrR family transcriptional regulator
VTGRTLTPRGEVRRGELIEHATRLFAENGFHPTSVTEIVRSVGVGKGSFYWYFEGKEQLLLEILKEAQHSLRRAQQQAIGDEADPVHRIELGIRASLRWSAEHRDVNILISFAATDSRFTPALRRGEDTAVADIMRHVRDGIESGEIRDVDPEMLTHAILGATTQLARVFIHGRNLDPDEVADNAVAFVRDGLLAD